MYLYNTQIITRKKIFVNSKIKKKVYKLKKKKIF